MMEQTLCIVGLIVTLALLFIPLLIRAGAIADSYRVGGKDDKG